MSEPISCTEKFSHGKENENSKSIKAEEKPSGLYNFLKLIEEMDNQDISQKSGSGVAIGPFGSKAEYDYNITINTKSSDFHTLKFYPGLLTQRSVRRHLKKRR
ncbi:MAG: hypothetical protein PHG79_05390 [Methanosarcina sp.]|nr:hypothetical protein [Methanosarcina sp.]MDD4522542.1 hypothetical protein [Methanosarcina sp.]